MTSDKKKTEVGNSQDIDHSKVYIGKPYVIIKRIVVSAMRAKI